MIMDRLKNKNKKLPIVMSDLIQHPVLVFRLKNWTPDQVRGDGWGVVSLNQVFDLDLKDFGDGA